MSTSGELPVASATKTILVVDDDPAVVETFSRMLKLEGFRVAAAADPSTGLELAEHVVPDAIVLDLRMPVLGGLQFLRRVRANRALVDVPVAIVTGDPFITDTTEAEIRSLGAILKFKPMYLEELVALVRCLTGTGV
ncbi:MAG TPA: response regulator [Vicinamibacterales bacterium]|nr:response regulator [Vicinamibacterales bacterium]